MIGESDDDGIEIAEGSGVDFDDFGGEGRGDGKEKKKFGFDDESAFDDDDLDDFGDDDGF